MQFVCDGPNGTWFRIETEGEAIKESQLMNHAVEKHFVDFGAHANHEGLRCAQLIRRRLERMCDFEIWYCLELQKRRCRVLFDSNSFRSIGA